MSESETQIAALETRVAELESQLTVLVDRAKDDDEQIRSLAQRINEYGARYDQAVAVVDQRVADALAQFGASLYEAFAKDVAKGRGYASDFGDYRGISVEKGSGNTSGSAPRDGQCSRGTSGATSRIELAILWRYRESSREKAVQKSWAAFPSLRDGRPPA